MILNKGDIILVKGTRSSNVRKVDAAFQSSYDGSVSYKCFAYQIDAKRSLFKSSKYRLILQKLIKTKVIDTDSYYQITVHMEDKVTHIWDHNTNQFERV